MRSPNSLIANRHQARLPAASSAPRSSWAWRRSAVYSDADAKALNCAPSRRRRCNIGPSPALKSYLVGCEDYCRAPSRRARMRSIAGLRVHQRERSNFAQAGGSTLALIWVGPQACQHPRHGAEGRSQGAHDCSGAFPVTPGHVLNGVYTRRGPGRWNGSPPKPKPSAIPC